jgi:hypothetical protein
MKFMLLEEIPMSHFLFPVMSNYNIMDAQNFEIGLV